jgi:DNA-binding MarR family transcriptional regulator
MTDGRSGEARLRRRVANEVKQSLRELSIELSLLNHQIGDQAQLRDVDLDCLSIIQREGPLGPSALARRAGLHPATVTGVLDRLESGGWVARERHPADRRAVMVRADPTRVGQLVRLYGGMNAEMDRICAGYSQAELELVADFLRRTIGAAYEAIAAP